jgi:(E)-4-hydroxy-3-methylbut-2-enyl-diphosphate synthase
VADIHFNQKIASEAAKVVEKVRINPGNFADYKKFEKLDYTDNEYNLELNRLKQEFIPLLDICKQHGTALRIGTNHGSLSDRIMSRYGDTPMGMAESAMEFLRICKDYSFKEVVVSMKASNTLVMVQAMRLLVYMMDKEDMYYPMHLGVTEAGDGEDGRVKSAVGIGALLADGIGDTIRVSLTEDPEFEIPVAKKLLDSFIDYPNHKLIRPLKEVPIDPFSFSRRVSSQMLAVGNGQLPVVISNYSSKLTALDLKPDFVALEKDLQTDVSEQMIKVCADSETLNLPNSNVHPLISINHPQLKESVIPLFIGLETDQIDNETLQVLEKVKNKTIILSSGNENSFADQRAAIVQLINHGINLPVIVKRSYNINDKELLQVKAASDLGGLFLDGLCDGIWVENKGDIPDNDVLSLSFGILQASRMRVSKPDYISCPSCGRTQFNIQQTTRMIRKRTAHLKGLKIGIMGCIVNGLGEMADADYGYIGGAPGKVNLYYHKELVKSGVKEDYAVDELLNLIKEKGDWIEP